MVKNQTFKFLDGILCELARLDSNRSEVYLNLNPCSPDQVALPGSRISCFVGYVDLVVPINVTGCDFERFLETNSSNWSHRDGTR